MRIRPSLLTDGVVVLRPLELADVDAHLAGEDEELVRWLHGGPGTPELVDAHIRRCMAAWEAGGPTFNFGIRTGPEDQLVGTIDAQLAQPYLEPGQANLAYGLYPAARGKGLATRAVELACRFLTSLSEVRQAVIRVDPRNPGSAAVALRTGFRFVGHRLEEEEGGLDWYLRDLPRD